MLPRVCSHTFEFLEHLASLYLLDKHGRINSQLGIIQNSSTERAFFSFAPKQVRMFPVIYCFLIFQASANISHNSIGDSDSLKVYFGRGTIASGYTPMENVVVRVQAHAKDGNIFGRLPLTQADGGNIFGAPLIHRR